MTTTTTDSAARDQNPYLIDLENEAKVWSLAGEACAAAADALRRHRRSQRALINSAEHTVELERELRELKRGDQG